MLSKGFSIQLSEIEMQIMCNKPDNNNITPNRFELKSTARYAFDWTQAVLFLIAD